MQNKLELNENELEKVTGGVSADDISNAKSLILQIITAISALEDHLRKQDCINHLNETIDMLENNDINSAKNYYSAAIDDMHAMRSCGLSLDSISDVIDSVGSNFGWTLWY